MLLERQRSVKITPAKCHLKLKSGLLAIENQTCFHRVLHTHLREYVDIHMVPDPEKNIMDLRIWWNDRMVHSLTLPLEGFRVHF